MRKPSMSRRPPSPLLPAHRERVSGGFLDSPSRILSFGDSAPSDANRLIERHEQIGNQGG